MRKILDYVIVASVIIVAVGISTGCKDNKETGEANVFGANASAYPMGIFRYTGEVDSNLTPSCGTLSSTTTTTDGSSGESSSSSSSNANSYSVSSYYTLKSAMGLTNDIMLLKYTYYKNQNSFSLSPINSSISTCYTQDGINCDASLSEGALTCETSDNIKCGGTQAFVFSSTAYNVYFTAGTGKIDWTNGFTINDDNTAVTYANLEIEMVSSDGLTVFQGSVVCISDNY